RTPPSGPAGPGPSPIFSAESGSSGAACVAYTANICLDLLSPKAAPHGTIPSDAILSPGSRKQNRRFTGLPGKLPVSRLVTTIVPPCCSHAKGSLVYWYLIDASAFHCLIAARPLWVCPSSSTTPFPVTH